MVEQRTFEFFFETLPEVRMIFINKMQPADRCRFSGCSRLSNKEAKSSKNYIYELELNVIDDNIYLKVGYNPYIDQGFKFTFIEEQGNKYVKCKTLDDRNIGVGQLDKSINLVDFAIHQFKQAFLHDYQNIIKYLKIFISHVELNARIIDFEIRSLNNLEHLILYKVPNNQQFFLKTRKNLETFEVVSKVNKEVITGWEKVYRVRSSLALPQTSFTKQQFSQLCAERMAISIGDWNEEDVFDVVKSWQRGISTEKIHTYWWFLHRSNFDLAKFFRLFGKIYNGEGYKEIEIKHDYDAEKRACFKFSNSHGARRIGFINLYKVAQTGPCGLLNNILDEPDEQL